GQLLPLLWPEKFFVFSLPALGLMGLAILAFRHRSLAFAMVLPLGLAAWFLSPGPPVQGSRYDQPGRYRYLHHESDSVLTASVVYDRHEHRMILFTDEFRAAYTGRDTGYMQVLGHLPFLLRPDLEDVAVIALGTGTTARAVCAWPQARSIELVEISRAVLHCTPWFT